MMNNKMAAANAIEIMLNSAFSRMKKVSQQDKLALHEEYKEWINGINNNDQGYEVLCLKFLGQKPIH